MKPGSSPVRPERSARRGLWLLVVVPLVLGAGGLLLRWLPVSIQGGEEEPLSPLVRPQPPSPAAPGRPRPDSPSTKAEQPAPSPEQAALEAERRLWEQRLERATYTLETYRKATRYPHESRPISEHPDQVYPGPSERSQPLSKDHPDIRLRLKQEKVFVVGEEAVHFFVGCENANSGQPLACEVHSALAHESPHRVEASRLSSVPLDFNDLGRSGDAAANDGTYTGRFQPARQGFALFSGTLRVEFQVRVPNGASGGAFFDILYTPAPPATFTGRVREAVEQGSLRLYVGLQVRRPGRYVVAGRVDDGAGQPLAYVSFNEQLPAGAQEVKFSLFGLLLRDLQPEFPLKLRDVEGFLLLEDRDPDRELLTSLSGYVHTTRPYPLDSFSEAEWQSEERERYLTEFTRDVDEIRQRLEELKKRPGGSQVTRPPP